MKRLLTTLSIALTISAVDAQTLPKDKVGKEYFKKLQTERVTSTDLIEWHQFGVGTAGYTENIWQHPTDKLTMIMSPDMHNTYGTWDGGETWHTIKDVDGDIAVFNRVMSLDFATTKPDFGMAVDGGGRLFYTYDKGHNWIEQEFKPKHQSALTADPTNEKVWYMGPGRFWDVKQNHREAKELIDPSLCARYKNEGYIYKTTDAGKTWRKILGLPKNIEVGQLIVNPSNPKMLWLTSNHGIYKSTNQGEKWVESYTGIPNRIVRDLDMHYDKKSGKVTLFALDQTSYIADGKTVRSEGGVYRSDDLGATWQSITGNLAIDLTKIDKSVSDYYYYRTLSGWFAKPVAALRKQFPEKPTNILSVFNHLKVNPLNINEIYLSGNNRHDFGFSPAEVWKTEDGGKTWIATARIGKYWIDNPDKEYWASRNNPTHTNAEFAHLQASMDRKTQSAAGNRMMMMGLDGTLYTGFEQQIFRTTDGGKSWQQRDDIETEKGSGYWLCRGASNLPGRFMLLETGIKERLLLCSGEHGLWQTASRDGHNGGKIPAVKQIEGQVHRHGAHSIADVAVDPQDPNIIYTIQFRQSHRGQFRRTTDGGKTWENIAEPLPWKVGTASGVHIFQNSLLVDPKNGKNIYFSVIENDLSDVAGSDLDRDEYPDFGVHRSQDGGFTWAKANNGLPEGCSVRRLAIDRDDTKILYAALNTSRKGVRGGLYRTTDGGDRWVKMSIPAEIESVNNIFIDRNTKELYISCGTPTGSLMAGGVWRSKDSGKSWTKIFFLDYIWQCETSPVDSNIILVNAAGKKKDGRNPGAYLSLDGGKSWSKVNQNLGQPNTITDLKPDPYDKNKFWGALKGSAWMIGYLRAL
ncbi:MAG: hypothetical protein SNG14_03330 [Rikenellaceae bacterium]